MAHDYTQCDPTCLECQRLDTLAQQAGEAAAEEAAYQADKVLHDADQCPLGCMVCSELQEEPTESFATILARFNARWGNDGPLV